MDSAEPSSTSDTTSGDVTELGRKLYEERFRAILEPDRDGEYIAIHVDSGDYAIEKSSGLAVRAILPTHPADGRHTFARLAMSRNTG